MSSTTEAKINFAEEEPKAPKVPVKIKVLTPTEPVLGNSRAEVAAKRTIIVKGQTPFEKLDSFCKSGMYRHFFNWDRFSNGFMMSVSITVKRNNVVRSLCTLTSWVKTTNFDHAKNVLSDLALHELGLSV